MKKFQLVPILIVALLFPISGNAGDKDVNVINTPLDVNVSNTPMVEVVNTDPIPVTMNESNGPQAISAYATIPSGTTQSVYAVPPSKTFILTDIFSTTDVIFEISENANLKTKIRFFYVNAQNGQHSLSMHLRTGIPFSFSSNVKIYQNSGGVKDITITGYLLNN